MDCTTEVGGIELPYIMGSTMMANHVTYQKGTDHMTDHVIY